MINLLFTLLFSSASLITNGFSASEKVQVEQTVPKEETIYMDTNQIFPSQLRYSSENVQAKIKEIQHSKNAVWDEETKSWTLKYDEGKSVLASHDTVPVVKGPYGYFLCDGHHHLLAALHFGAATVPVKVIADLSDLDEKAFWEEMEKQGWAYPYNILGKRATPPRDFKLLQDDPNRYFAALIARKCAPGEGLSTSRGADYPVWIKVGQDIPFIEFRISDALWQQGLRYEYAMGSTPPEDFVEEARAILKIADIPGLKIVPKRTHISELHLVLSENPQEE